MEVKIEKPWARCPGRFYTQGITASKIDMAVENLLRDWKNLSKICLRFLEKLFILSSVDEHPHKQVKNYQTKIKIEVEH